METIWQDLKYGARMLFRNPAFTATAVATLALGIGANTAIFSVVDSVLIQPLPYRNADRLVVPVTTSTSRNIDRGSVSYADYVDWKSDGKSFEQIAVFWGKNFDLTGGSEPERVTGLSVSEDYFKVMAVEPALGRSFVAEEHHRGGPKAAVLSHGLWQRRFGGDPNVLGSAIKIGGEPYTVVGVMPEAPIWPRSAEVWTPLQLGPTPPAWVMRRDNGIFESIALLRPDVSVSQARALQQLMGLRVVQESPESKEGWSYDVVPLRDWIVEPGVRRAVLVLLGAVLCVLMIACVNVAGLMLARGAAREREFAIRAALGAGRGRLILQLLSESAVLALASGGAGLLLAIWGVDLLLSLAPRDLSPLPTTGIDGRLLLMVVALSMLAAIGSGIVPALHASRTALSESLKEGRSSTSTRGGRRVRTFLVVTEIALSLVLLVGAGLMVRTILGLSRLDPGFRTDGILTFSIGLPDSRYPDAARSSAFYHGALDEIRSLPGVKMAAACSALPVGGGGYYLGRSFIVEGRPEPPAGPDHPAQWNVVSPEFFATLDIRLLRGRYFTARDDASATPVMIINESMARSLFGDEDPLGKRIRSWRDENVLREVVGVVRDVRYFGVSDELRSLVYVPHRQDAWTSMFVAVRADGDRPALISSIRQRIGSLDRELAIGDVSTMNEAVGNSIAGPRFSSILLAVFAGLALVLALVGIYGLVSYSVQQRTHEIGVRMALGAKQRDVLRMVAVEGLRFTVAGVLIGLAGSLALTRVLSSLLFGVSATDPATFLAMTLALTLAALAACYVPARRATKVDPMTALRCE